MIEPRRAGGDWINGAPVRLAAIAAVLAIGGCGDRPVTLPADPPALVRVDRYGFGDVIHARDSRAMIAALDVLEPRYGRLRTGIRELPKATTPEVLRAQLAAELGKDGWAPAPELARWQRTDASYAFGWHKDGKIYAVVGLEHRAGDTAGSPVTILTNIGDLDEAV